MFPSVLPISLLYPINRTQPVAEPNKNSVGKCAVCASTYRCSKLLSCAVIALDFYPCIASLAPLLLLLVVLLLPPISHIKDAIDVIKSSSRNIIVQFLPHRCIRQTHPHLPPKMEVYFQTFFFFKKKEREREKERDACECIHEIIKF